MRVAVFAWVLVAVLQLPAQQTTGPHPTVSGVMQGMKSPKWGQRSEAFGEAAELLASSDTSPKDADPLRLGIIQLLVHENNGGLKEPDDVKAEDYGEGYGEDKAEYYAGLIEVVASFNDERAIPALLGAAGSGGMATRTVARFGKDALAPTLAQVKSEDPDSASGALFVILDMLEFRLVSDPESHLRIKNALRLALASPEYRVRENAMRPIEYLDDKQDFVPILKDIAERDPYKSPYNLGGGGNGEDQYSVRRAARLLLSKIANHEQPIVDKGLHPSEYQPVKP